MQKSNKNCKKEFRECMKKGKDKIRTKRMKVKK